MKYSAVENQIPTHWSETNPHHKRKHLLSCRLHGHNLRSGELHTFSTVETKKPKARIARLGKNQGLEVNDELELGPLSKIREE